MFQVLNTLFFNVNQNSTIPVSTTLEITIYLDLVVVFKKV